ncbi:MAG: hypothetical protein KAI47_20260 [Deltaproteobacteria bacterium]|nr:hypothetical protein [Deltaproteobacteria bacterium]
MVSSSPDRRPTIRVLAGLILALALLPLLVTAQRSLIQARTTGQASATHASPPHARAHAAPQTYYLPPPAVLRSLSFGYNELFADLIWIQTITYFSDHLTTDRQLPFIDRYLRVSLALDPHIKGLFRYGAAMLTTIPRGNPPILQAINLLRRGHRLFPRDYHLPLRIGTAYMIDLHTQDAAQRRRWKEEGANWIHRAILLGAKQPWLASLAAQVFTREGKRHVAIQRLQEIFAITQDPATRKQIALKLRQLKAANLVLELRKNRKALARAQRDAGLFYVSTDLFTLLRLPPLGPLEIEPSP